MPANATADPDFMAASPSDQMRYLSATDPDFAKADPRDQLGYLSHLHNVAPVAGPKLPDVNAVDVFGQAGGEGASGSKVPRSIQQAPDEAGEAIAGATIGGAGILAGAPAIAPVARAAGSVMKKHPLLSYAAIEGAKHIPGIGPYLSKVPGIEWLPMLAGGDLPGKIGRFGKIGAEAAEGAGAEAVAAESGLSKTRLGPEAPPAEITQSRGLGRPAEIDPAGALGKIPVEQGEELRSNLSRLKDYPVSSAPEVKPQIQTPIERAAPSAYPPEEPASRYRIKAQNSRAELIDDKGVQEQMRGYLENQDKQVHAFEPIGKSKGAINEEFNEQMGKPSPPVKYTKTPAAKASSRIQNSVEATPADADLEQLLRDSVDQAKKKKGR